MPVNLTQYQGEIGVFNVSIITIKIKHRPISRRCYFCNTNQVYRNIYFFLYCYLLFYYITSIKKTPQNLTPLYRSVFLLTILYSSLDVQVKNIYERWYWNQSRSCAKKSKSFMVIPKRHCWKTILQPTKWISFVYRKPILTLAYNRIMII